MSERNDPDAYPAHLDPNVDPDSLHCAWNLGRELVASDPDDQSWEAKFYLAVEQSKRANIASALKKYPAHWTIRFLRRLRQHGNVSRAGAEVGVNRCKVYRRIDKDPAFAEKVKEAQALGDRIYDDRIEQEITDRALAGKEDKASHLLLMFKAKARKPEYRDGPREASKAAQEDDYTVDLSGPEGQDGPSA